MLGSGFAARTKEEVEYEKEFTERHINNEVKTFVLSKEEIEEKYGEVSEIKRVEPMSTGFKRHYVQLEEGGRKVIFNAAIVKEDLINGLCKSEIYEKYDAPNNVKSRFFNVASKQLIAEGVLTEDEVKILRRTENEGDIEVSKVDELVKDAPIGEIIKAKEVGIEKVGDSLESKEIVGEVASEETEEVKEVEGKKENLLTLKRLEIEGSILSYAVKEKSLDLIKGTHYVNINKCNLKGLIAELTELQAHIED